MRRRARGRAARRQKDEPPPPGGTGISGTFTRTLFVHEDELAPFGAAGAEGKIDHQEIETAARDGESEVLVSMFSREQIESVRPEFIVPFLQPFSSYCASRGLLLEEASRAHADPCGWLGALDRVLSRRDRSRPAPLAKSIERIAQLSDDEGHERLLTALQRERDALDAILSRRPTALELALVAHDGHPSAFDVALRHKQLAAEDRFWEFLPSVPRPLTNHSRSQTIAFLETRIADRYRRRGQTGFCEVVPEETSDSTRFLLMHGVATRAFGVIDEAERRARVRVTPERCDFAVIDHRTGRLGLHIEQPTSVPFFCALVGEALFGAPDYFARIGVYSGAPLLERGVEALSLTGVSGLRRVQLRACKLVFPDGYAPTLQHEHCIFETDRGAEALRQAADCRGVRVAEMKFAMVYDSDGRERVVTVRAPNWIRMARAIAQTPAREFLTRRRFADYGTDWSLVDHAA